MSRVVLDTNVLLALWIFADSEVAPLRAALERGDLRPVRSEATDAELTEVLARPELFGLATERQVELLRSWQATACLIESVTPAAHRCRDPLDQKFIDLAVSASADWLITRDKDLLKLRRKYRATALRIVTPKEFILPRKPGRGIPLQRN